MTGPWSNNYIQYVVPRAVIKTLPRFGFVPSILSVAHINVPELQHTCTGVQTLKPLNFYVNPFTEHHISDTKTPRLMGPDGDHSKNVCHVYVYKTGLCFHAPSKKTVCRGLCKLPSPTIGSVNTAKKKRVPGPEPTTGYKLSPPPPTYSPLPPCPPRDPAIPVQTPSQEPLSYRPARARV